MDQRLRMLSELSKRHGGPPPGVEIPPGNPNAGVDKNVQTIIGVSIFSIVLATSAVFARFVFRKTSKLQWMADDYLIVLATILANADAALYLVCIQYGFGQHIYMVEPTDLVTFFKYVFITFQLYGGAVSFVKFSVLSFYNRIFPNANFKKWLMLLGVLSMVWWILCALVAAFQCMPIQKAWNAEIEGTCIPYLNIFIGIQVANIVLDIAIICLPISAVMGLQMSKANKISVAGTFALGGLSIVFAVVRLAILVKDKTQTDITYDIATANWSLVEPSFEIFCACLPCMTPVLRAGRFLSKIRPSSLGYGSKKLLSSRQSGQSYRVSGGSQQPKTPSHECSSFDNVIRVSRDASLKSENRFDSLDEDEKYVVETRVCGGCGRET